MVMPNLYGNIVNNVCAGLVGGPGLVAGANYGHVYAVFETVSGPGGPGLPAPPCCVARVIGSLKVEDFRGLGHSEFCSRHRCLTLKCCHPPKRKPYTCSLPLPGHHSPAFCHCGFASYGRLLQMEVVGCFG